jgi:Fe2+ or Zn2+ uptake regulation protein
MDNDYLLIINMRPKEEIKTMLEIFKLACHKHGLRLTPQKVAVFEELARTYDHPSAQSIYDRVKTKFPDLSFSTVYKNLNLLSELGLIMKVDTPDGIARFDADTKTHHHAIETATGKISDVTVRGKVPLPTDIPPKKIKRISITYYY